MISVQSVTKRFGNFTAVNNASFEVGKGEIIGFLGPNGAGKTTTMRMLTGFLPVTEGRAVVANHDVFEEPMKVRQKVGYLPETPPLYPEMTVGTYLEFISEIRQIPSGSRANRIGEVMELVGLEGWEQRILGSLSKGYRQRVGLAQAVIHDPEVLVLDEPTSGLDPAQVVGIREFIQRLATERTVILSTHILSEVELLCPRVVMINKGVIVADDQLDGLRSRAGRGVRYRIELKPTEESNVAMQVSSLEGVEQVSPQGEHDGFAVLEVRAATDPRTTIAAFAIRKQWQIRAMEKVFPSLEEVFLSLVGGER